MVLARWRRELAVLLDVATAVFSYFILLSWHVHLERVAPQLVLDYTILFPVIILVWGILSLVCRPDRPMRQPDRVRDFRESFIVNFLGGMTTFALVEALHASHASRLVLGGFPVLSLLLVTAVRLLVQAIVGSMRRHGFDTRHALIVGPPERALPYARSLLSERETGIIPVGVLLPSWEVARALLAATEEAPVTREGPSLRGGSVAILGDYSQLREAFQAHVIDQVILLTPLGEPMLQEIAVAAETEGKVVQLILDDFGTRLFHKSVIGRSNIVPLTPERDVFPHQMKRLIDIVGASLALGILSPVLLLIAIAIKIDSPEGPVIFRQERVGLHGRRFPCYKFRSMVPDAERLREALLHRNEMNGPVFKIRNDPRITRVGRILRRFSLDELPQFANVLVGHMSLVGPRPPLPEEVQRYPEAAYRRRLSVRPGLTCLWQVSGRNAVDFDEWMKLDLQYVDQWSLGLDLKILLRTIPTLMLGTGM